jgi:hypothetical protein
MKAGTAKKRKFIPVHAIVEHLQMNTEFLEILPGFHALTGSEHLTSLESPRKHVGKFLRCITVSSKALETALYSANRP